MKILIVDDSRAMRRIVQRTIRQAGLGKHEFVEAADGKEALTVAEAESPDLILSDWHMPDMSGMEFLVALRATGDKTVFGFVTSEDNEEMRQAATDASFQFSEQNYH